MPLKPLRIKVGKLKCLRTDCGGEFTYTKFSTWCEENDIQRWEALAKSENKGGKLKCLRTDCGGEFTYTKFSTWCEENDIQRQLTTVCTLQQNRVVERKNKTIMGLVKRILKEKSLPLELWVRPSILVFVC